MKNWDAVIDFLDDVSSSEGLGVARHSTAPHAITPHRGEYLGHLKTTYARHSSEWETETLLDQSSGSPDVDMAAYPCPFRKRNPSRFNIRDHESCARTPFDSVFGLKHHIITHHRRKPARHQCRRCKQQFDTEIDLEEHLLLPKDQMCEVNTSLATNPEDGITEGMARMLAARDSMEETWTWEGIWRLVFPGDPEAPDSDFQPVAELVEVEQAFDEGHEALKESLREKLQLLLPPDLDGTYLGFLTGQLELVFETHRVNIMKQSLSRCCSTTSQEQPSTAINNTQITTEQQGGCPPRKQPNRRSRRNTLLQQPFQRNKTQDDSTTRRHSSRPSSSTRHTSYYRQSTDRPLLPHNPRSTHPVSSEEDEQHDTAATNNTSTNSNSNSSSSRDSGIGMPCDTCDSSLAADGGGCRFSPESFMQRVLRKQLVAGGGGSGSRG
ncbi:hypothetical protein C8A00DRAFT_12481 [Chaetomidium leptoderma]|uniref:C2H2-type domain-containing protein n=1 Tax=Chaetomidium leptoderma TaxID=669021 RepID=A0AAN7A069_9PEZI|nr:hypothetical protein C8A00DRAFT_12481 [Chaetomidium leptoderma]